MSAQNPDHLPLAVERLLEFERQAPPPPPGAELRVHVRLQRSLAEVPAPAGPAGPGQGIAARWASGKTAALLGLSVMVAAVAIGWRLAEKAPQVAAPKPGTATSTSRAAPPARITTVAVPVLPAAAPMPIVPAAATGDAGDQLREESRILRAAKLALREGRITAALAFARTHARRWPRGTLEQEREILMIQALDRAGQAQGARLRAQRFLIRFPASTLRNVAEAAVSGKPPSPTE